MSDFFFEGHFLDSLSSSKIPFFNFQLTELMNFEFPMFSCQDSYFMISCQGTYPKKCHVSPRKDPVF